MAVILTFFVAHWLLSVFSQTFFLHRYSAHRMFTMSHRWERFFHLFTLVTQGSSYLLPRGYAILHREHHAYSDTPRDPHSPHQSKNFLDMMWKTARLYGALIRGTRTPEPRFEGGYPTWDAVDRLGNRWAFRIGCGALYTAFYVAFAPHWAWFLLLPAHYMMGPIHGAIVNYGGHKIGYRNFDVGDESRNTLPFDFLTLGELFQNNHHKHGMNPKFSVRWFEVDPTYMAIRLLDRLGVVKLRPHPGRAREEAAEALPPAVVSLRPPPAGLVARRPPRSARGLP